jgi:dolichyl-phosphate-mannose--protein O-mannosyl transferase
VTASDALSRSAEDPPSHRTPRLTQGLSVTADGRAVPAAGERLTKRRGGGDVVTGWVVTAAVTLLAGILRLWQLGTPRTFAFDETYYAKDGWSLWQHGYARNWEKRADRAVLAGQDPAGLQNQDPTMVVHPEVGKWMIGAGQQVFGFDPFGWRVASAVVGALMVLVMVRLVRRLTGSTLLGGVAGLLLCFDGLHFVLSRLALLDIFVAFFLLSAVSCLVADRDWARDRLAERAGAAATAAGRVRGWGPRMWWRPWRLAAGVLFGLAVGSKWTALVPLAGFAVLSVLWDSGARRSLGVRWAFLKAAVLDGLPAFGYLVVVALVVYVASWAGWLVHADAYEQALARNSYGPYWGAYTTADPQGFLPSLTQGLRSLWHYHQDVWAFHTAGLVDATHAYQSAPQGWLVMQRPVVVATELDVPPGTQGCSAPADSTCLREVILLGTPVLWWAGVAAHLYAVWGWLARRDWRYGVVVVGLLTTWVPFFRYADRPIFSFYAVALLPFTIVALCLLLGRLVGPEGATPRRRVLGSAAAGAFVVLVVLTFAWFWPVYTYELISTPDWLDRIWFRSWI